MLPSALALEFGLYSRWMQMRNVGMFKIDLHVHSWYSPDAADSPEDLVRAARSRGLDGIVLTDHNTCEAYAYCLEAGLATADGLPVEEFLILPGVEVSTAEGHLLCIGTVLPARVGAPAEEVCAEIRAGGGELVPAHPFDHWRSGIREATLDVLDLHCMEIFNAAVSSRRFNQQAAAYAEARGLWGTAGSDAHHASAVGISHTEFDVPVLSIGSIVEVLRSGPPPRPQGTYLSKREAFKKHFANFFRKGKAIPGGVASDRM